jgi:opine dehydrogenase
MKVAIVGAGAVALSSAALLVHRGHETCLWSAFSDEIDALIAAGGVTSAGALAGFFPVPAKANVADCIRGADVVMIAAPAFAHAALMAAVATHISNGQLVVIHTATGMSSLILAQLLAQRGVRSTIVDLGTSVCTSRKTGPVSVTVAPLKAGVDMATLPADRCESGHAVMEQLFGELFTSRENVLAISINNHNPVYHVPAFLFSLALVEKDEAWNIWANTTPLIAQYVQRLDDERLVVAKTYGVTGVPVADYVRQSVGVVGDNLPDLFAAAAAKRPNPTGPRSLEDRYITEDVPFGLAFFIAVGAAAGVSMPLSRQLVDFISSVYGRDFTAQGHTLATLGLAGLSPAQIVHVVTEGP